MARTVVITGSSSGIGFALAEHALGVGDRVLATVSPKVETERLQALRSRFPETLLIAPLDVTSDASVHAAARECESRGWSIVDVLINNAGTLIEPAHPLQSLQMDKLHLEFEINTFGPIRVTRAFLPLILRSKRPIITQISARKGSLTESSQADLYGYRMSKCALNMFNRVLANELRPSDVICLSLHPGWVKTAMGRGDAPLTPDQSAERLWVLMNNATAAQSGGFFDVDGDSIPW